MPPQEKSSLQQLEERLNSQQQPASVQTPPFAQMPAPQAPASTPDHWQAPPPPKQKPPRKPISVATWFLIGASLFLLVAMGVAAFFLFSGVRLVSSDKIDLSFEQGPSSIASGTAVPLIVTVTNHNPTEITNTSISIDFPDGTRSATDVSQPLGRYTDTFGSIPANGTASKTVQAVLFGSVNQQITIPVTFQYRTENSNAVFTKQQNYTFTITSSPLTITAVTPSSVASGQPFSIDVTVRSNATTPLDTIAVSAQYPSGYSPSRMGSATTTGPLFKLGTLKPGEEKKFTLSGALSGTDNTQRNFEFTVGTLKNDGTNSLALGYASSENTVTVTKPFLSATLSLNNSSDDPLVVSAGQGINGAVSWANTLTSGITNGQITVRLAGNALNTTSVTASNGFYDSAHGSVVFSRDTAPGLAHLNASDTGTGTFSITTKSGAAFSSLRQPTIQVSVGVSGTPDGSASQSIASTLTRTIHISTDLLLSTKILHSTGSFANSGPFPPLANQSTTYTVQLGVTNDVNDVAGAKVSMILPSYVTFTGQTSPSDGSIVYDSSTHTVTWKVGDIPAGTVAKPVVGSFQVSLLPSTSQVGQSVVLVQNQLLTGTDRFTNTTVQYTGQAVSTSDDTDPGFKPEFGNVTN